MDEIINNNQKLIDFLNNYSEIDKPLILNKLSLLGLKNLENKNLNHFYTLKELDNLIINDISNYDKNTNSKINDNNINNKNNENISILNKNNILNENVKNNINNEILINKIDSQIHQNESYFKNDNLIPIKNFDEEIEKKQLDSIKKRIEKNSIKEINLEKPINNNNNNKNLNKFINKPIENLMDLKNIESNLNTNFLKNKINFNNNLTNLNNLDVNSSIEKKHLIPIKCCPICNCICKNNNYCNNCDYYKNFEKTNFNINNCNYNLKESDILKYPYLNYDYSRFDYPKEILKDKSYERTYEMKESYEHFK